QLFHHLICQPDVPVVSCDKLTGCLLRCHSHGNDRFIYRIVSHHENLCLGQTAADLFQDPAAVDLQILQTVIRTSDIVSTDVDENPGWKQPEHHFFHGVQHIRGGKAADAPIVDDPVLSVCPEQLLNGKLFHQGRAGKENLSFSGIFVEKPVGIQFPSLFTVNILFLVSSVRICHRQHSPFLLQYIYG